MRNKRIILLVGIFLMCKILIEINKFKGRKSEIVQLQEDVWQHYSARAGNKTAPHILFIIADDLGFNDVGYHGSEIKTPNLDNLALTGVRLENYYVQPVCTPTRGQLLTGRYQIHTGLHWVLWPATPAGLALDNPTIADKLRDAGYATHMVGKWHLGFYKADYLPTSRGFDTFFGFLSGHSDYYTHVTGNYHEKTMIGYDLMENNRPANISKYNGTYSTHLFGSKVKDIINEHDLEKPMFIYMSFQAVHAPLQVPENYVRQYSHIKDLNRRQYAGMVSCMDETIGDIVETMKKRRMWEKTLLIFTTDNGGNPKVGGSNLPLKGTKSTLWEGGIRAVGFVHSSLIRMKKSGYISNELMHVTDWFPTLVNLAGGDLDGTKLLDGYDQWQTIKYGIKSPRREILHNIDPLYNNTFYARRSSLRIGAWKIIIGQLVFELKRNYVVATREQLPLKPAYALTIHKSQGMTLDRVEVDCRDFLKPGQLGVAIGKARSSNGLKVVNFSERTCRKQPDEVLRFNDECNSFATEANRLCRVGSDRPFRRI